MFAEGIQSSHTTVVTASRFRDKQRIIRQSIFSWFTTSTVHRCINIQWDMIYRTGCFRQSFYIFGIIPCHEYFISIDVVTEDPLPRSTFYDMKFRLHLRMQLFLVFLQECHQLLWDRCIERLIGSVGMVSCIFEHSYLVFHLYHNHGIESFIYSGYMLHQILESMIVSL